ncbi:MAG: hypothetical protein AAFS10_15370, partial [Myxococcota bacterium]
GLALLLMLGSALTAQAQDEPAPPPTTLTIQAPSWAKVTEGNDPNTTARPSSEREHHHAWNAEHLEWIRTFVKTPMTDPLGRYALARRLDEAIGAEAVRAALPHAFPYPALAGGVVERRVTLEDGTQVPYTLYVPRDYDRTTPYPMHIHLHGGGSGVTGHASCFKNWGRAAKRRWVLVCPSTPEGRWWTPEGDASLEAVYKEVIQWVNIDTDRVSVGGLSNGGTGTWHLALKYPWQWSVVVPRCAARMTHHLPNMAGIWSYVIHGALDHKIKVENSRKMTEALERMGQRVEYVEVADGGHQFFRDRMTPKLRWWMLKRKRRLRHRFVYSQLEGNDPGIIHWVDAPGLTGTLRGQLPNPKKTEPGDEGFNRIELESSQLSGPVRVYLPTSRIDLNAPVHVLLNGTPLFEGHVTPSAWDVLSSYARSRDRGRIFTASVTIHPPPTTAPSEEKAPKP